ncbi:MAG: hypothetical protein HOW73_17520 [Polyangiaceae bacterium]|nr:hypothetical protein [Polyangiaceae bacterium]
MLTRALGGHARCIDARRARGMVEGPLKKIFGISGRDVRRYGLGRADALLSAMGLRRKRHTSRASLFLIGGLGLLAIVGAGLAALVLTQPLETARRRAMKGVRSVVSHTKGAAEDLGERVERMRAGSDESSRREANAEEEPPEEKKGHLAQVRAQLRGAFKRRRTNARA